MPERPDSTKARQDTKNVSEQLFARSKSRVDQESQAGNSPSSPAAVNGNAQQSPNNSGAKAKGRRSHDSGTKKRNVTLTLPAEYVEPINRLKAELLIDHGVDVGYATLVEEMLRMLEPSNPNTLRQLKTRLLDREGH